MIKKGLIIRHLVLPNQLENTRKVLKWISENLSKDIYVSIMTQYFPTYKANEYEEINRKITKGIENGYMQDFSEEDEEQYVPKWEY